MHVRLPVTIGALRAVVQRHDHLLQHARAHHPRHHLPHHPPAPLVRAVGGDALRAGGVDYRCERLHIGGDWDAARVADYLRRRTRRRRPRPPMDARRRTTQPRQSARSRHDHPRPRRPRPLGRLAVAARVVPRDGRLRRQDAGATGLAAGRDQHRHVPRPRHPRHRLRRRRGHRAVVRTSRPSVTGGRHPAGGRGGNRLDAGAPLPPPYLPRRRPNRPFCLLAHHLSPPRLLRPPGARQHALQPLSPTPLRVPYSRHAMDSRDDSSLRLLCECGGRRALVLRLRREPHVTPRPPDIHDHPRNRTHAALLDRLPRDRFPPRHPREDLPFLP